MTRVRDPALRCCRVIREFANPRRTVSRGEQEKRESGRRRDKSSDVRRPMNFALYSPTSEQSAIVPFRNRIGRSLRARRLRSRTFIAVVEESIWSR